MGCLRLTDTLSLTASSPNSVHNVSRNTFISLSFSLFSSWQLSFLQFFSPFLRKIGSSDDVPDRHCQDHGRVR